MSTSGTLPLTVYRVRHGPQRMLMLKHAIDDIRLFWQNDLRFLKQF